MILYRIIAPEVGRLNLSGHQAVMLYVCEGCVTHIA